MTDRLDDQTEAALALNFHPDTPAQHIRALIRADRARRMPSREQIALRALAAEMHHTATMIKSTTAAATKVIYDFARRINDIALLSERKDGSAAREEKLCPDCRHPKAARHDSAHPACWECDCDNEFHYFWAKASRAPSVRGTEEPELEMKPGLEPVGRASRLEHKPPDRTLERLREIRSEVPPEPNLVGSGVFAKLLDIFIAEREASE